jgi:methylated-DNA-[protein]-cysteine S-methyltransferase
VEAERVAGAGPVHPTLQSWVQQLEQYFSGTRRQFEGVLVPTGTDFQQKVWQALQTIPYGQTVSYLELARTLGNERAVRAVGRANGRNPIAIVIPCHRVIGRDGRLTGYGGGLWRKEWLLRHEGSLPASRQIRLF